MYYTSECVSDIAGEMFDDQFPSGMLFSTLIWGQIVSSNKPARSGVRLDIAIEQRKICLGSHHRSDGHSGV